VHSRWCAWGVLSQLQCSELEARRDQLRAEMVAVEARLASLCAPGANETKEAPLLALPSQSTAITSLSAMRIPFSEQLVRSGETIVGNLVVAALAEFLASRFAAFFLQPGHGVPPSPNLFGTFRRFGQAQLCRWRIHRRCQRWRHPSWA